MSSPKHISIASKVVSLVGRDFSSRVQRNLKEKFERYFRYNSNYKPKGVYKTSKEYFEANPKNDIEYFEIYPKYVSHLPMSDELFKACSDYAKPLLTVETDYITVKIPQGRIYTNNMGSVAIISHDNKLIGDVSFQYKNGKVVEPKENSIFSQSYFIPPLKLPGTVFSMLSGGGAINNIGHWLMDALPRLHLLKESGLLDSIDWFLVPSIRYDYQRDSLKILGIPSSKIIEGDKIRHVEADYLVTTTAPRGEYALIPRWSFNYLREQFLGIPDGKKSYPSLIHISRKDSKFRTVLNEDELVELITPYGFETVTLSKLSFIEKVNLFANADVILGACGAGLTNVYFCKKGAKLIELFSEGFVLTDYIDIAYLAEMEHHYTISPAISNVKNKKQGQRDNYLIDLKQLKRKLDEVFVTEPVDKQL